MKTSKIADGTPSGTGAEEWIQRAREAVAELRADELAEAGILPPGKKFFPTITYPPQTMYPAAMPADIFADDEEIPGVRYGAYVHIPFCAWACKYCHWVKTINPAGAEVDAYLDLLVREMDMAVERLGKSTVPVSSVLFGGGTPTYLTPAQLERTLTAFRAHYDLSRCRQFSYEAEPASILGDEGMTKLKILKAHGVDRISLGVQSFRDDVLKRMGRHHSGDQALQAIEHIRKAGIGSVSIDLIYGYPGLTLEGWIETMEDALRSGADAWHLYRLRILRHGDRQGEIIKEFEGQPQIFPDVDTIRLMKMLGKIISEAHGYHEHFTRIFATSEEHVTQFMWDYCCRLTNVIGHGPSAWSNFNRTFTLNVGSLKQHQELVSQGKQPVDRGIHRDLETEARRSLLLPLKNVSVIKAAFLQRTGLDPSTHFGPELARLKGLGLLDEDDETIFLTPRGRFFADETIIQLYQRKYLPFDEVAHDLMVP